MIKTRLFDPGERVQMQTYDGFVQRRQEQHGIVLEKDNTDDPRSTGHTRMVLTRDELLAIWPALARAAGLKVRKVKTVI